MITPAYSLTATERVLPRLALDFTTASLDARVTVTRALNTATRTNSSGYIETVNADLPRFDFNPSTLKCNGLLIEEARTNLALQSLDLNSSWSSDGTATMATNVAVSPTGNQDASQLQYSSAAYRYQFVTVTAGNTYTYSFYAKLGTGGNNTISSITTDGGVTANLSTGLPISGTGLVIPVGNGWYRLIVTFVASSNSIIIGFSSNGTFTSGQGHYYWGAQLELGAFATSYIPTTTTSLTRNADVVSMTGTNFSDWYVSSSAALAAVVVPSVATGTRPIWQFDDTTTNEIIALRGNVANPELYIVDNGALQAQLDAGTIAANTQYGLCAAFTTNSCAVSQNGATPVTTATATMPTVTQARIGSDGSNFLNGAVRTLRYWPQRILNAETQAFSK